MEKNAGMYIIILASSKKCKVRKQKSALKSKFSENIILNLKKVLRSSKVSCSFFYSKQTTMFQVFCISISANEARFFFNKRSNCSENTNIFLKNESYNGVV